MKVAFFGTPDFATVALEQLIDSKHEVVCVVTQPDKPAGRGRKITPPPVKVIAEREGIEVMQPISIKKEPEFGDRLAETGAEAAVVVAYGQILPGVLLDRLKYGFFNIHASLLPKYRGAAPIQWAIAKGERKTGVTIMQIDEGLDSGPIVAQREIDILEDDDAKSVHDMLSVVGANAMVEVLDDVDAKGEVESKPQNHDEATYAPLIKREDAGIDWKADPESVICKVRGFAAWPGAFTETEKGEVKILGAGAADQDWVSVDWKDERVLPGTVVDVVKGQGIAVKAGNGLVLVTRLKPAGKKEMDAEAAANGGLIQLGTRFKA